MREKEDVLREWVRVLKPGGVLKVAVPDLGKWAEAYVNGTGGSLDEAIIYGGQTDENDYHRSGYSEEGLRFLLRKMGLVGIRHWQSDLDDCAATHVSLNLQGTKPPAHIHDPKWQNGRVIGVFTTPRVGFVDPMRQVSKAFASLSIGIVKTGGAYFHFGMDRAIQSALDETDAEYILTMDYDTLFDTDTILSLLTLAETHPEADAIVPAQIKRECGDVLVNVPDEYRAISTINRNELVPIEMGHFGLTLIRASAMRKMPKPWFAGVPDEVGGWGDEKKDAAGNVTFRGRIDPDVNFWRLFKAAGFNAYMASWVSVGHMQLVATWPGADFQPVHQFMSEYDKSGRPGRARQ